MPVETCSEKPPLRRFGIPVANSRFSRPRATSPRASDGTLPCSAVRKAAMSLRWASTRFRIRNRMSVRFDSDVARQAGKAAFAAAIAASTSSTEAKSTSRASTPVAGSKTGPRRPDVPATRWPPIQWLTVSPRGDDRSISGSATWVMDGTSGGTRQLAELRRPQRYRAPSSPSPAGTVGSGPGVASSISGAIGLESLGSGDHGTVGSGPIDGSSASGATGTVDPSGGDDDGTTGAPDGDGSTRTLEGEGSTGALDDCGRTNGAPQAPRSRSAGRSAARRVSMRRVWPGDGERAPGGAGGSLIVAGIREGQFAGSTQIGADLLPCPTPLIVNETPQERSSGSLTTKSPSPGLPVPRTMPAPRSNS